MANGTLNATASASEGSKLPPVVWWNAIIYGASLGLVGSAFALRSLLAPVLGNDALYLFLVPPVLLASVFGGIGPGVFATVLSLPFIFIRLESFRISRERIHRYSLLSFGAPRLSPRSAWRAHGSGKDCSVRAAKRLPARRICNRFSTLSRRR